VEAWTVSGPPVGSLAPKKLNQLVNNIRGIQPRVEKRVRRFFAVEKVWCV